MTARAGRPEVYVTGLGLNTPLGAGAEAFWPALVAGTSGVGPVTRFDTRWLPVHMAAQIKDLDGLRNLSTEEQKALDPAARLALSAGRAALADAGWLGADQRSQHGAVDLVFGTTHGDLNEHVVRCKRTWETQDLASALEVTRDIVSENVTYSFLYQMAQRLGLTGWQSTNTNACAASGYALSLAVERIRQGLADVVLAGGMDLLAEPDYTGFCSLRAMAPDCCRPFDRARRGLIMGEAGAALVLESGESLRQRGGKAYARVLGYGWSSDAYHLSTPHPEGWGTRQSVALALKDAGLKAEEIDGIVAHGTGTPGNDRTEAQAFREVFGERVPPVTAPKSMIGHAMGAASAIEAVIGVLSLKHQTLPPTINHEETDPECPVEVVRKARSLRLRTCLTNSSGFGGNNDSLVFGEVAEAGWRR
ncbi:MAG: beta-ketoacyl-[acyl-carrier-protein] synthase family protein [candidate division FCPU426 bacterium]